MRRFTQTGRVVYDRQKHFWKPRDIIRMGKKLSIPIFGIPSWNWDTLAKKVSELFYAEDTSIINFGGGEFGGGGASRTYQEGTEKVPDKVARMIIIVETEVE